MIATCLVWLDWSWSQFSRWKFPSDERFAPWLHCGFAYVTDGGILSGHLVSIAFDSKQSIVLARPIRNVFFSSVLSTFHGLYITRIILPKAVTTFLKLILIHFMVNNFILLIPFFSYLCGHDMFSIKCDGGRKFILYRWLIIFVHKKSETKMKFNCILRYPAWIARKDRSCFIFSFRLWIRSMLQPKADKFDAIFTAELEFEYRV